jgi:ABC-type nickel/cobalt efflux system permease component RcnA
LGGDSHHHEHDHKNEHTHVHENDVVKTTPWVLFLIFVFGPCEPLIPILMYPAAQSNFSGAIIVSLLFSVATIGTMMSIVLAFKLGLSKINLKPIEKYSHVIAGATIFFSGIAIQFLGL